MCPTNENEKNVCFSICLFACLSVCLYICLCGVGFVKEGNAWAEAKNTDYKKATLITTAKELWLGYI